MQMLKAKLYMLKQQENEEKISGIRGEIRFALTYFSHTLW